MDETVKKEIDKYLNNICDFETDSAAMKELRTYLCAYKEYATKFFSAKRNMYNEIANREEEIFNTTTSFAKFKLGTGVIDCDYPMLGLYKSWLNFFDKKLLKSLNEINSDFNEYISLMGVYTFKDPYAEDHYMLGKREANSIRIQLDLFITDMIDTLKEIIQKFEGGQPCNEQNDNKGDE